jgi:hypothetical protein
VLVVMAGKWLARGSILNMRSSNWRPQAAKN